MDLNTILKYLFGKETTEYWGLGLMREGVKTVAKKVESINNTMSPTTIWVL